jgi:hypothetical protein
MVATASMRGTRALTSGQPALLAPTLRPEREEQA